MASSDPAAPSGNGVPDVATLLQLLTTQAQASALRDQQFQTLMERMSNQTSTSSTTPPAPKSVSAERPVLLSTATMAEFTAWEEAWRDYAQCQCLASHDRHTRMSAFRQALDEDLRRFIREGIIAFPEDADIADAIPVLQQYIRRQRNPLLDRIEFYKRRQQRGESFDSFYTALRELFHACDFSGCSVCHNCNQAMCNPCKAGLLKFNNDILRDRIVTGVFEDDVRHKLLALQNLDLEATVKLCRAEEAACQTSSGIPSSGHVHAAKKSSYKQQKASRPAPVKSTPDKPAGDKCPSCGRSPHTKGTCPAKSRKCNGCQRVGHFQSMCPHKGKPTASGKVGQLKLQRASVRHGLELSVHTQLNTEPTAEAMTWIPDTGSDVDAIGPAHLSQLGGFPENLAVDSDTVSAANGTSLVSLGKISATLSIGSAQHTTLLHVYEDLDEALLSCQSLRALGILPESWPRISRVKSEPSSADIADVKTQLMQEFADVFDDSQLKPMAGPPMEIKLQSDATPTRVNGARAIPFAFRDQIKSQLDDMVINGIIEPVTEPSDWCHPIVIADKKSSNEKRLTVDLRKLNDQVCRPTHPARTPRDAVTAIGKARFFTTLDARHGYWQIPLSDDSKPLTTFITPWGRYRYCRNPQGLSSAGDEFNCRTDAAFDRLANFVKVVDDGLVHDVDFQDHVTHVRDVLHRAREHHITLSPHKFVFGASEVQFCGFVINADGYAVDGSKTSAIRQFEVPCNRTDLRSFFGLVNQCSDFTPRIAELSEPLRPLLKTSNEFAWDQQHTIAFQAVKAILTESPVLAFFQPGKPLRLETDASVKNGLGFALWQQHDDQQWHLIQCGSRFLSDAETRYAVIELECLAVVWAVHKCRLYLSGAQFSLITDHRPLVPIINSYTLDQIENSRLLRLIMKLRPYQVKASWRKGSEHVFADALSRHPVSIPTSDDELGEDPALFCRSIRICLLQDGPQSLQFAKLRAAAASDPDYQMLLGYIQNGFPSAQKQLPEPLRAYWNVREHLSTDNGIVLKGLRIVVPASLRASTLIDLHAAHQGLTRTKRRARQTVYWPGMNSELDTLVRSCDACREFQPSQSAEPPISDRKPTLPFESVSADLFSCQGCEYLVFVDRLTGWPCIAKLGHSATSADVIRHFRRWFPDVGVPQVISTDGGPQFASHRFAEFCERWGIRHIKSSPHYPQSNGHAEAAVKAMKYLVEKTTNDGNLDTDAFQRGLLEWRNTPGTSGKSPAQLLYGRPLVSFVLAQWSQFDSHWQDTASDMDDVDRVDQPPSQPHRELSHLSIGTHVDIQHPKTKRWSSRGVVVAIGDHRDYYVKLPSGRVYWRNRRYLRPYRPPTPASTAMPASSPVPDAAPQAVPVTQSSPQSTVQVPPRTSQRPRRQNVPFNIISTRGQSYN
ncbi:uncharacterized protein K02A2.6-like [Sycon ciliatum]|uniref:uncharacterized protein K02A2.6-like n=1 Tax=Sycon ciliatum TaxID=27933 RepID=UPI0031F6D6D3